MGQAARETILDTFSQQKYVDNWNNILEKYTRI